MAGLPYPELCRRFLSRFATDIPAAELADLVRRSYAGFDRSRGRAAQVRLSADNQRVLELFHGPTLAFKDIALQLLGNLYARQCAIRGETINVLGATSGDTGAAAIHGLMGKPGVAIFILYPDGRVSPLQERQMACTGAANVHVLAVDGSFDAAQAVLKELLGDEGFKARHRLSAVNSINIARVLAQCVYYLHAWLRLPPGQQEEAEFVVPTGNFGTVLAGWMLQRMGVPIRGFRVATNQNDILHRFFTTGEYRVGAVSPSLAPSMDIQVASNFERFIYYSLGGDGARVRAAMTAIKETGPWTGSRALAAASSTRPAATTPRSPASSGRPTEAYGYIVDPHTACAFKDLDPGRPSVAPRDRQPRQVPRDDIRGDRHGAPASLARGPEGQAGRPPPDCG